MAGLAPTLSDQDTKGKLAPRAVISLSFPILLPRTLCATVQGAGPGHFQSHLYILLLQPKKYPRLSHRGQPRGG